MNAAPCILTNATFHSVSPLGFQKAYGREPQKIHNFVWYSSQSCPQSQHSLLAHTIQPNEGANSIISELGNVMAEWKSPRSARRLVHCDAFRHAKSGLFHQERSSHGTSPFPGPANTQQGRIRPNTNLSVACIRHGLNNPVRTHLLCGFNTGFHRADMLTWL